MVSMNPDAPLIVIAVYRPKEGKTAELEALVREHLPILLSQDLVTTRPSIAMRAKDGTIVEVFEWKSLKAIEGAHTNPAVIEMWTRFGEACTYQKLVDLEESQQQWAGFEPFDLRVGAAM
jgi:hypothetical protein